MKLNLGCADFKLEGYVNVDCRSEVNPDVVADVRTLEIQPESVDEIYCSHLLEHLNIKEARGLILKMHGWLKPKGKLYLSVPNLQEIGKILSGGVCTEIIFNWIFGRHDISEAHGHKWGYTFAILKRELEPLFSIVGDFVPVGGDATYIYEDKYLSLNVLCEKNIGRK